MRLERLTIKRAKYVLLSLMLLNSVNLKAQEYRLNEQETSKEYYGIYGIEYTYNNATRVMGLFQRGIFVTNKINGSYDTTNEILLTARYKYIFGEEFTFFKTILGTPIVSGEYHYYYASSPSEIYSGIETTYLFNNAENKFFEVRAYDGAKGYEDVEQNPQNKQYYCMNRRRNGDLQIDVYDYNLTSDKKRIAFFVDYRETDEYQKKLIILDDTRFILITSKSVCLYQHNSASNTSASLIAETKLPDILNSANGYQMKVNSLITLPDGTYSFVLDYGKNTMIVHIDATTKIKNVIDLGDTYYTEEVKINGGGSSFSVKGNNFVQACYKKGDTIIYFGGYNNEPALYEINLATGKFEVSNVDIPLKFYKNNTHYGAVDIKYINKKVYINLGFKQRVYQKNPVLKSGVAVYEPIPPTVTISTPYANIGDNTPVAVNVSTSKEYPILNIFNETTQQSVYWGTPQNVVNYNWNGVGNVTLTARLHDTDGELLSVSNPIVVNQNQLLNTTRTAFNNNTGLQQFVVIDDVERHFENNSMNQQLIADIKAKASGTFLIYKDVCDVLVPLLKP